MVSILSNKKRGGGGGGSSNNNTPRNSYASSTNTNNTTIFAFLPSFLRHQNSFLSITALIVCLGLFWNSIGRDTAGIDLLLDHQTTTTIANQQQQQKQLSAEVGSSSSSSKKSAADASTTKSTPKSTITIAYAISLVKCGDKQSTSAGLVDAALVMRHSIHLQSARTAGSGSKYDYKMYAIVHRDAIECSLPLRRAGFSIVVKDPPIQPAEIVGSAHLKKFIHKEWCCGHDEFIKLFAYEVGTANEPIVVHVDIDFAFYQPMDDLYDAILLPYDSAEGKLARARIPLERPDDTWPNGPIDGFITRDYPQLLPGRIPGYQAGFLVARRDLTVVPQVLDVIRNTEYDGGFSRENGWGNKGYGGYVGAMAMQGLMAYYYDIVRPNTTMELNSCRFNHMGMDNLYRANPSFRANSPWVGKCRSTREDCEDCTTTNTSAIYNVHYTQCRKPWNCVALGVDGGAKGQAIDTTTGKLDHCLPLIKKWHALRKDFETKWFQLTGDIQIKQNGTTGVYRKELFLGHCNGEGKGQYLQLMGSNDTFSQIPKLYDDIDE